MDPDLNTDNVSVVLVGTQVIIESNGYPDHTSPCWSSSHPLYVAPQAGKRWAPGYVDEFQERPADVYDESSAFLHTESFFLIDRDRRIRGVYNGMNSTAVSQLIEDARVLLAEG